MAITIRPVDTVEGATHFQTLEQMIWESPPEDTVPLHVTITVIRNGGGLLGAFAEDGPPETGGMVGLVFWFPGIGRPARGGWRGAGGEGRGARGEEPGAGGEERDPSVAPRPSPLLKMCSHMAGVLPAWQGQGIGLSLKLAQREAILAQGLTDWVTWTYDPLIRTNAVFNIHRLGAVCNIYRRDWYGAMLDGLNAGTPSDRCQVDWWLKSERVVRRVAGGGWRRGGGKGRGARGDEGSGRLHGTDTGSAVASLPALSILPVEASGEGFRAPVDAQLALDGAPLAVPIPDDIGAIRRSDPALGMAWRHYMRHTLEAAFAAGYRMADCLLLPDAGWHYLLDLPGSPSLSV